MSTGGSSAPVELDAASLDRLRELDPDGRNGVLVRVLVAFETSLARMLVQLAAERVDGNPGVVASVAHTLKSSSGYVGALELTRLCAEIDRELRQDAPEGVRNSADLQDQIERLMVAGEGALAAVRAMLRA